jgi:hypothetical protein
MVATVETWDIDPEFPVEEMPTRRSIVTPSGAGAVQRSDVQKSIGVDSGNPFTRLFVLRFQQATKAEADRYVALWELSGRGTLAIAFTPPGGTSIPVRILGKPRVIWAKPTTYQFSVSLEEVTNA